MNKLLDLLREALEQGEWIQGTDDFKISGSARDRLYALLNKPKAVPGEYNLERNR